jgi:DNA-directed RNA polymerase subunit RPC12/RpoP
MKMEWICKKCGKQVTVADLIRYVDCDGERLKGLYCSECNKNRFEGLVKERVIEVYHNNQICLKDGRYYPYWGCAYYFDTLEGARKRIDNPYICIVPL